VKDIGISPPPFLEYSHPARRKRKVGALCLCYGLIFPLFFCTINIQRQFGTKSAEAKKMARLMIRLLGPLQVSLDGVELNGFDSNKVRALLAYLIVESDRAHSRRSLAGLLWPDSPEESAQANLRHVLANLRKIIGDHDASPPFLTISRQSIQFNLASDVWCDVLAFSPNGKNPEAQEPSLQSLEANIASYRGSFLEGFFVTGSASFEEWTLLKRERLERIAASTLEQLVSTCHLLDEKEKALGYAWRLIELEPWREASWQKLIWLLSLYGQRGAALAQFDACRRALEKELGVKPSVETIALYESIRDGNGENGGGTFPAPGAFTPS
jgi:DNA-binding SARP family transcriptional activator